MTRPISDLDVPLPTLQEQVADLVARQRAAAAPLELQAARARFDARMTALHRATTSDATPANPNPTAEEAS